MRSLEAGLALRLLLVVDTGVFLILLSSKAFNEELLCAEAIVNWLLLPAFELLSPKCDSVKIKIKKMILNITTTYCLNSKLFQSTSRENFQTWSDTQSERKILFLVTFDDIGWQQHFNGVEKENQRGRAKKFQSLQPQELKAQLMVRRLSSGNAVGPKPS